MTTLLPPLPLVDFREQRLTSAEMAVKNGKPDKEKIDGAAEDFEALLLQQMFDSMWSSVPEGYSMEEVRLSFIEIFLINNWRKKLLIPKVLD
jgi:hypothetical protein